MRTVEKELRSLQEALKIDAAHHRLIAVTGAGGKTTLIYLLARELRDEGKRVLVTTTTHMYSRGEYGFTPLGSGCAGEKTVGFSADVPKRFLDEYDIVLVEADGSRRHPLKVPAEHEPVIPDGADLVIGVAGASAVGRTFREACHRYELACRALHCVPEDLITLRQVERILTGDCGQRKGVTCEYRYVLNQAELLSEKEREELAELENMEGCVLSLKERKRWTLQ